MRLLARGYRLGLYDHEATPPTPPARGASGPQVRAHCVFSRTTSAAALLAGLAALALTLQAPLLERMETAAQETQQFMETEQADTSVGHRFAHWQMAWRMGLQKPLWGWGRAGYEQEKQALVERGQAPPSVLRFSHAHNEVLDAFVRRGLAGALAVLAFYAVPLAVFNYQDRKSVV